VCSSDLAAVVAGSGAVLVSASPVAPAQDACQGPDRFDDQPVDQSGDLVAGQRDQPVRSVGLGGGGEDGEQGVGEHRSQGPASPGGPAADLVFVQAGQGLGGLEGFLGAPAGARDADQFGQRDRAGCVAAVVGQLAVLGVAADQQPAVPGPVVGVQGDECPV